MTQTLHATSVTEHDLEQLEGFRSQLPADSPIAWFLARVADATSRGVDITLLEEDKELSPTQAADMLGVSRGHVRRLMDDGVLIFRMVGSHRRVRSSDLIDYMDRQESARRDLAQAQAYGAMSSRHRMVASGLFTPEELSELGMD